jgi:pantoate--beta-alanine ligase
MEMNALRVISDPRAMQHASRALGGTVGAVFTMGALHAGHLALVDHAQQENDHVVASIFVNPTQFAANEDFSKYPRMLERDLALFERAGVEIVFAPSPADMYPNGFQTTITVQHVSHGLEGARRPAHFDGVATVVCKLIHATAATRAYFGQKDAQQVVVIRRMVADLNLPVEIIVIPTLRDADGLAMSSRNAYLTAEQRAVAPMLHAALQRAGTAYADGERESARLIAIAHEHIANSPHAQIEYISVNDPRTLEPIAQLHESSVLISLAVQIGTPRLLDNLLLPLSLNTRDGLTATLGATS